MTNQFVDLCKKAVLTGFEFREVWSSKSMAKVRKVFKLNADISFRGLNCTDMNTYFHVVQDLLRETKSVRRKWKPLPCRMQTLAEFHDPTERTKAQSKKLFDLGLADCISTVNPVFSTKAVKVLKPLCREHGEFLPIDLEGDTDSCFLFHCTSLSDAVDLKKSTLDYFSDGSISRVITFQFIKSRLKQPIFRLQCLTPTRLWQYVTDEFVEVCKDAGLTGFDFAEVWG